MEFLAALAGHPERCAPSIHIAGSKGKGSVTGMLSSMLEAAGRRVARYMSPHVSDYRERISLGSVFFDEEVYRAAGAELRRVAESLGPDNSGAASCPADPAPGGAVPGGAVPGGLFDPRREEGEGPSFFELLTLYFFLCARRGNCDVMTVETGMGGRLDSTNIVDPLVSAITVIELEHTEFLGNTLAAVAGEKAGIIKPGRPLVLGEQPPEALGVFRKRAAEKGSPLLYLPEIAEVENIRVRRSGTEFRLGFRKPGFFEAPLELYVPVPGAVYARNAALAVAALKTAFPDTGEDAVRRGLERFRIPARFELVRKEPPVIIDGAHTPGSAARCCETFRDLYGEGGILLFGCAAGKNAGAMAEVLLPHFSRLVITTPGTFKISEPEKVYDIFRAAPGAP
ncbi:MAG: tetrahydrofolate synthase, partial [Treponema sp.]|nr:tetrahydrofolate synthase [Treponema sp.]